MKHVIIILLLIPAIALSQTGTANKYYSDETGKYRIKYEYDSTFASTPAVQGAEPHYDAIIWVFKWTKDKSGNKEMWSIVGDTDGMFGTYVKSGCFEDVPSEWVRKAKEYKPESK